ncbi:MAG: aspartate carbamoyltransferase [Candidatus Pacebacteria bacterium]|nr:aspartate carbamoyltransferase [Candidatus Paceibacterota bacterium]MCF7862882.1 aspartate carbamoyltransferase [Candidatus Paceibacterota bacterium]
MQHIISSKELSKDKIESILNRSKEMEEACKKGTVEPILKDKIVACIFFEPSTRTRLSFETASLKLGAQVISAENAETNSSAYKGETIEDTTKILSSYADIIVIRHHTAGMLLRASKVSNKPVINAGDGANEHPSQALLDLYTIQKEHGRLDNLTIAFGGDLTHSRTLHSLVPLLTLYPNNTFYFISPKELALPKEYTDSLQKNGVNFKEMNTLKDGLKDADILYMTRVQKERFENAEDYEKVKDLFILKKEHLAEMKKNAIIMHPLPKINEIELEVDSDPRASYFRQAENGLYVRMAMLEYVLKG